MWKNYLNGHKALIIGNGPSLESVPQEFLRSFPTYGCNNLYVMKEKTGFQPWFYTRAAFNHLNRPELRECIMEIVKDSKAAFIGRRFAKYFPFPNVVPIYSDYDERVYKLEEHTDRYIKFSTSPLEWVGVCATVTFINLQLAYYMGAGVIGMLGVDHDYSGIDRHFYKDEETPLFPIEDRLNDPEDADKLARLATEAYKLSRQIYEDDGRKIYNLTPDSKTDAFEFMDLEDFRRCKAPGIGG